MQIPAGLVVMTCGAALVNVAASLVVSGHALATSFLTTGVAAGPWICAFVALPETARDAGPAFAVPYVSAAVVFAILALAASHFPLAPRAARERLDCRPDGAGRLRRPAVEAAAFFCCVGVEMAISCFLAGFCVEPEIGGWSLRTAAGWVVLYWAGVVAGRAAGAALLRAIPAARVVGCAAVAACLLVTVSIGFGGRPAIWSLMLAGAFVSLASSGIFALHAAAPGRVAPTGAGLPLPALAGGFVVPVSQYLLAERIGLHAALVIPAVCCLYLIFSGFAAPVPRARRMGRDERRSPVCSIDSQRRSF
jgi:FHS family L-fucose permease-like MFS transporter